MSLLGLLIAASQDGDDPAPLPPTRRNVASTTRHQVRSTVTDESYSGEGTFTLRSDAEDVTLVYGAGYGNRGIMPTPNDVTYQATVNGIPVTWNGAPTGLCPAGKSIESDPITVNATTGDTITVATTVTAPGGKVPWGPENTLWPTMVRAVSDAPNVIIFGSSSGQNPNFPKGFEDAGLATINASIGGSHASNFNETGLDVIGVTGDHGITHAFLQVGINSNGRGAKEMCQNGIDLAWRCRGRGIPHITQMVWKPHTTSTDGWTTVEGQTPKFPDRAIAVDWLRRGAPVTADGRTYDHTGSTPGALYVGDPGHPFDAICDWSSLIQDAANPDAFRVDHGPISWDGLHINATGYELGRPVLRDWAQAVMDT